jgi:hypothetical protein
MGDAVKKENDGQKTRKVPRDFYRRYEEVYKGPWREPDSEWLEQPSAYETVETYTTYGMTQLAPE